MCFYLCLTMVSSPYYFYEGLAEKGVGGPCLLIAPNIFIWRLV